MIWSLVDFCELNFLILRIGEKQKKGLFKSLGMLVLLVKVQLINRDWTLRLFKKFLAVNSQSSDTLWSIDVTFTENTPENKEIIMRSDKSSF